MPPRTSRAHISRPTRSATPEDVRNYELHSNLTEIRPKGRERDILVRIYQGILADIDFKQIAGVRTKLESILHTVKIKFNTRTLSKWNQQFKNHNFTVDLSADHGRSRAISDVDERIFVGWVLHQNNIGEDVTMESIVDFLKDYRDLDVSLQTVRNYCGRNGLGYHMAKIRANPVAAHTPAQCEQAFNFIKDLQTNNFYDTPLSSVFFMDSTFTRRKTGDRRVVSACRRCDFFSKLIENMCPITSSILRYL